MRSERPRDSSRRHRKERVLHTRISEPLAEDIRRVAEDLRVPVSNLVRNVLEEAFSVVEAVTDDVGDLLDDVVEEAERARGRIRRRRHARRRREREHAAGAVAEDARLAEAPADAPAAARAEFPEVVGWQPLILNQPVRCADCEEPVERGERAFAGMGAGGPSGVWLCRDCTDARR